MLASASPWHARIGPRPAPAGQAPTTTALDTATAPRRPGGYPPWADLLRRTFAIDVLACPKCNARMKLVATITKPSSVARFLTKLGEPTDVPARSPSRGPPYWEGTGLRRNALGAVA